MGIADQLSKKAPPPPCHLVKMKEEAPIRIPRVRSHFHAVHVLCKYNVPIIPTLCYKPQLLFYCGSEWPLTCAGGAAAAAWSADAASSLLSPPPPLSSAFSSLALADDDCSSCQDGTAGRWIGGWLGNLSLFIHTMICCSRWARCLTTYLLRRSPLTDWTPLRISSIWS